VVLVGATRTSGRLLRLDPNEAAVAPEIAPFRPVFAMLGWPRPSPGRQTFLAARTGDE